MGSKLRIYCDGACSGNPGPGGWGSVLLFDTGKQIMSGGELDTTNNRMELTAAVESVRLGIKLGYEKIDVYSDSAYVVNAIKNNWLKRWELNYWKTSHKEPVKNKDLWVKMLKLLRKEGIIINFIKVKGHAGDTYNEMVDRIARHEAELLMDR